jgi:hypothetical protein
MAGLVLTGPAAAEEDDKPADPCVEAAELREQLEDLQAQIQEMIEAMKPICAKRKQSHWAADECARRQVEAEGFVRSAKELNAQRKVAEAECKKRQKPAQ